MIPTDKVLHFIVGAVICLMLMQIIDYWAILPIIIIGALKEIYDKVSKKGTPDFYDFLYTVLGGSFVLLFMFLSDWILK